jgi:hypothetical protein
VHWGFYVAILKNSELMKWFGVLVVLGVLFIARGVRD